MRKILLGAAFVVCWSSGFVGSLLADDDASSAGLLAWRYLLTSALLVLASAALHTVRRHRGTRRRQSRVTGREVVIQIVLGALSHTVFLGAVFASSSVGIDAGLTSLVCALQPLLVTTIAAAIWRDRVTTAMIASLFTGVTAVALSVGGVEISGSPVMLALPVAALLSLSTATLIERACRPSMGLVDSLTIQTVTAAVCFAVFAITIGQISIAVTSTTIGSLIWLVLISGIGGYASFTACLRNLGATSTSALLFLTPPVTTVWSWLMFGQSPSATQVVGLALGIIAVTLLTSRRQKVRLREEKQQNTRDPVSRSS